jgi:hypothetical protein
MAEMGRFHWITIMVAFLILLIVLIFIGILMTQGSKASKKFPPLANSCPDFWLTDSDGYCVIPSTGSKNAPPKDKTFSSSNTPGLSANNKSINFQHSGWTGICAKKKWCNTNQIFWDGIDNYNDC